MRSNAHALRRRACAARRLARPATSSSGQRARGATSSVSVRPERQPLGAGPGDHGAVVGAQLGRRRHQHGAGLEREPLQHLADRLVGGDAAGGDQRGRRAVAARGTAAGRRAAGRAPRRPPPAGTRRRGRRRPGRVSGAIFSASSRSAVFRPESEKSASVRPCIGRGSAKRVGIAARGLLLDLRPARIAEARAAWRSCRRPRRWRRRPWCRAARSRRRRAPRRSGCGRRRRGTGR